MSAMRDAVELGATVTTDDGDVPMDLPDGSKSSNSMQISLQVTQRVEIEAIKHVHCNVERSVCRVGNGSLK